MASDKYTPEEILDRLKSISKIEITEFGADFYFGTNEPMMACKYRPGSFTRKLLELIEESLDYEDQ